MGKFATQDHDALLHMGKWFCKRHEVPFSARGRDRVSSKNACMDTVLELMPERQHNCSEIGPRDDSLLCFYSCMLCILLQLCLP